MNVKPNPACLHREITVAAMMKDMIFALCTLLILPVVYYGWRPLILAAVTVLVCGAAEMLCCMIETRAISTSDFAPIVTGLMIAMLMPVNVPLWVPSVAAIFSVMVVRAPFGFTGHTPFNPAAAGVAFVTICWPDKVFAYISPDIGRSMPAFADIIGTMASSPASTLKQGLKPEVLPLNLLWGNVPGAMGTTALLIIGACGAYLFLKRTSRWETTVFFLLAATLIAALMPRIACSMLTSIKYELLSGSLFFCAVFMVTDPVTSPHSWLGRCVYGAFAGFLLMMFRHYGAYEQGACFAILLANAFSPLIDSAVCACRGWGGKPLET